MKEPKLLWSEFLLLISDVQTRRDAMYSDVPLPIYQPNATSSSQNQGSTSNINSKRKYQNDNNNDDDNNNNNNNGPIQKKPKIIKIEGYHPMLKEKIAVFSNCQKLPHVKNICEICNINANNIFPNCQNLSIKSTLFGTCFVDYKGEHIKTKDSEAKHALKLLETAIKNSSKVKVIT